MRGRNTLTRLERRILTLLAEAGEEDFAMLTNMVAVPYGRRDEIEAMSRALTKLVSGKTVELEKWPEDMRSGRRAIPHEDTPSVLANVISWVEWSQRDRFWMWKPALGRVEVCLTKAGSILSRQILMKDGWPSKVLDTYE